MLKTVMTEEQRAIARERARRSIETARAAAELAISADNARRADGVARLRGSADVVLKYRNVKSKAGLQVSAPEERVLSVAGDVFTVSSTVVSAIALPGFAQRAATSFRELRTMIHDNAYNTDQRLAKLEELARSSAGTVFSAQGVVVGGAGTLNILRRRPNIAPRIDAFEQGWLMRTVGAPVWRVMKFLLPIADFAVLTGEMIATRRVFMDPTSTVRQRTRKTIDISLATLKMSLWMLPGLPVLRTAYNWASMGQLGLIMLDYRDMLRPHFIRTLQGALWAITHPAEAMGQALLWTTQTIGKAVQFTVGAIGAVLKTIIHPVATWNAATSAIAPWYRAYVVGTGQKMGIWKSPQPSLAPIPPATNPYGQPLPPTPLPPLPGVNPLSPNATPLAPATDPFAQPLPTAPPPPLPGADPLAQPLPPPVAPLAPATDPFAQPLLPAPPPPLSSADPLAPNVTPLASPTDPFAQPLPTAPLPGADPLTQPLSPNAAPLAPTTDPFTQLLPSTPSW